MAEFSELIKNFDKIRDYMRDFYIYGFKARGDFSKKSARTYDNEKRRCESYLGRAMKWSYAAGGKVSFVSADCGSLTDNPLFSAWKSKSFTDNDILLHFYLLDALQTGAKTAEELTEHAAQKSGRLFDLQTVRGKCNEYVDGGMLEKYKDGKSFRYRTTENVFRIDDDMLDAVKFFQSGNLGVIGSYLLDNADATNDLFVCKHYYLAHTLEDGVLYDLLTAIRTQRAVELVLIGSKNGKTVKNHIYPVKILCSRWSGRRYLCAYLPARQKFSSFRLDTVKSVAPLDIIDNYGEIQDALSRNLDRVWSVSFDGESRNETGFSMVLHIDELRESHILARLKKEGRGGILERLEKNTFRFTKEVFDANEAMPWIKTFIGRILSFSGSEHLNRKLTSDLYRVAEMYGVLPPESAPQTSCDPANAEDDV